MCPVPGGGIKIGEQVEKFIGSFVVHRLADGAGQRCIDDFRSSSSYSSSSDSSSPQDSVDFCLLFLLG
jgi:hypothetical protein